MLRSYVNVLFCALKSLLTFVVLKQTKTKNIHKTLYSQTLWFSRYNVYSMMIFFPKKEKRKNCIFLILAFLLFGSMCYLLRANWTFT